jgi:hypothetical protein
MQVFIKCVFLDSSKQDYESHTDEVIIKSLVDWSNNKIQGKFRFFDNEEQLRREWKLHARANIRQRTFLEGILLKSLDHESESLKCFLLLFMFMLFVYVVVVGSWGALMFIIHIFPNLMKVFRVFGSIF